MIAGQLATIPTPPFSPCRNRRGLTVLEVLVAFVVFVVVMGLYSQTIRQASDRANDVREQSEATRLCRSKMAEFIAGVIPLQSGQGSGTCEDAPDWQWSAELADTGIPNLWAVTIKVNRQETAGSTYETTLRRLVFDPSQRGSTLDAAANSSSASGSSTSPPATSTQGGN